MKLPGHFFLLLWIFFTSTDWVKSFLRPPPGSLGTIDFRFPDNIVNPLPDCHYDGVFPILNVCTWYYRCFLYIEGYFHREYFQCAPGTIFDDVLDICTAHGNGRTDCKSGGEVPSNLCTNCLNVVDLCAEYTVCPKQSSTATKLTLCKEAVKKCSDCGYSKPICKGQENFSPFDNKCYPPPDHPSMVCCNNCSTSASGCQYYEVCPAQGVKVNKLLCPNAVRLCNPCKSKKPVCTRGKYLSMEDGNCYPNPDSPAMSCTQPVTPGGPPPVTPGGPPPVTPGGPPPVTPGGPPPVTPGGPPPVTPGGPPPVTPGGPPPVTPGGPPPVTPGGPPPVTPGGPPPVTPGGPPPVTPGGPPPVTPGGPPPVTPGGPPPVTPGGERPVIPGGEQPVILDVAGKTVTCSKAQLIPQEEWIQAKYCKPFQRCTEGKVEEIRLCTNYYHCFNLKDKWTTLKLSCPGGTLYSYSENKCRPKLQPKELC